MRRGIEIFQPVNNLHQLHLYWSLTSFFCLILAFGSIAFAQSGRKSVWNEPKPASKTVFDGGNIGALTTRAFLVVTPAPPRPEKGQPARPDYESYVRGACLNELLRMKDVKVMEDEKISSREARELAQLETHTYVIWMELKWVGATQYDQTPFRLRYLLLEPDSGKTIASGYGTPALWIWGLPHLKYSLEEQLQEAGRNVASKVMMELRIKP
jgi:hypothetical protein